MFSAEKQEKTKKIELTANIVLLYNEWAMEAVFFLCLKLKTIKINLSGGGSCAR